MKVEMRWRQRGLQERKEKLNLCSELNRKFVVSFTSTAENPSEAASRN